MDAAFSSVNKSLNCPVDDAQVFKDPEIGVFIKDFAIAGFAVQSAVAAINIHPSLKDQVKRVTKTVPDKGYLWRIWQNYLRPYVLQ